MGQFSWLDCKDNTQILDDVTRDVFVLVPAEFGGGHIKETCYDGYGHFGGLDIYDLVAEWNREDIASNPKHKYYGVDSLKDETKYHTVDGFEWFEAYSDLSLTADDVEDMGFEWRCIGIDLACYDVDNAGLKYPIKITHDAAAVYEDCQPSKGDPNQGWYVKPYDPSKRMPEVGDVIILGEMAVYVVRKEETVDWSNDYKIIYRDYAFDDHDDSIVYVYGEEKHIWADDFNKNEDYECEVEGPFDENIEVRICGKNNPNWENM